MIWDCFPYWREHRLVKARQELWRQAGVDVTVVAFVGDRTHRGDPKPDAPAPPDGVRVVDVVLDAGDDWGRERQQRDAVLGIIPEMATDDVVLICDADEIVDPDALDRIECQTASGLVALEMWAYLFDTDWRRRTPWLQAKACRAHHLRHMAGDVRGQWTTGRVHSAGWHLTYQDDIDGKLRAFAHAECDSSEFRARIERCRSEHLDFEGGALKNYPIPESLVAVLELVAA